MHTRKTLEPCKIERRVGRSSRARARAAGPVALTAAASISLGAISPAMAGPSGGVVVEGQGSISTPTTNSTVIDQSSQNLQLNWGSFDVGASESVRFNQPSSKSVALNRILDQNPSQIFGRIDANGQVVLVNPNGLLIGRTAQLDTGSLVVSSLDAVGFDAASGRYSFSATRNDVGAVINEGTLTAGPGGSVTLLGGRVSNSGSIVADFGTVNLASGRAATLDLAGDGLLRLEVGSELISNSDGSASALENSGSVQANGGRVLLTASAVKDVFANLINNTGVVRANRIDDSGGTIRLVGPEGVVKSSGTLDASAGDSISTGGRVEVLGDGVGLLGDAVVDVSGATGGGTALIGGDYQGSNRGVPNASRTLVSAGTTINADAGDSGDGGRVIVWADNATRYDGNLSARGGSLSGNGGFAEVSGKQQLEFNGTARLTAANGKGGSLLLDPRDITIDTIGDFGPPLFVDDGQYFSADDAGLDTNIGSLKIENILKGGTNVFLQASRDITQLAGASIDATGSSSSLALDAGGKIELNDVIIVGGNATFNAHGGDILMQTGSAVRSVGSGFIDMVSDTGNVRLTTLDTNSFVTVDATLGALQNDGDTSTVVRGGNVVLSGRTGIGAAGAGNALDTQMTRTNSSSTQGGIFLHELDGVFLDTVDAPAPTADIAITTETGNLFVGSIRAGRDVGLLSSTGAILDQPFGNDIQAGRNVTLRAGQAIGTIGDFLSLSGQAVRVAQANAVTAQVFNGGGQLHLEVPDMAVLARGSISLGTGTGATGSIILRSPGDLNLTTSPWPVTIGNTNTASVALVAGGRLRMPGLGNSATDFNPGTLLLQGNEVVDVDGSPNRLRLTATNAYFRAFNPQAPVILDTNVGSLGAIVGNGTSLEINEANGITLHDVVAGNVTLVALGNVTGDNSPTSTVTGNTVRITAQDIAVASGGPLQTVAAHLDLTATTGGLSVVNTGTVEVTASAPSGPAFVVSVDGDLNVTSATAGNIFFLAYGPTSRAINVNGAVTSTNGPINLTSDTPFGRVVLNNSTVASPTSTVTITAGQPNQYGQIESRGGASVTGIGLTLTGSSIGSAANRLATTANSLSARAEGGAGLFITETDGVTVSSAVATAGKVDIRTAGGSPLIVNSASAGNGITFQGGGSSALAINTDLNGGTGDILLETLGAGTNIDIGNHDVTTTGNVTIAAGTPANRGDFQFTSGSSVTGGNLDIRARSIGLSGAALQTNANTLNAEATNGGIFVQDATGLEVAANAGGSPVEIETLDGSLVANAITGNGVSLQANGANGNITLNGALNAGAGAVNVRAQGDGSSIAVNNAVTTSNQVSMIAGSPALRGAITAGTHGEINAWDLEASAASIGAANARLKTSVGTLDINSSAGGIFVTEANDVDLLAQATGGILDVRTTAGALNVFGATGNAGVTLSAGGGSKLTLETDLNGGTAAINLAADGAGGDIDLQTHTITTTGDVSILAGTSTNRGDLTFDVGSSVTARDLTVAASAVGAAGTPFLTTVESLDATSLQGGIFVAETDDLGVAASATGGPVQVTTNAGVLTAGNTSGDGVTLTAVGAGNGIVLAGLVNGRAGTVALSTTGAITNDTGGSVAGHALTASAGSIGTQTDRLDTAVDTLDLTSSNGGIYVSEADDVTLAATATGGTVDVLTLNGALTVSSVAADGVTLATNGAGKALNVNGGSGIDGRAGDIALTTNGEGSAILVLNPVTTTGNISLSAGTLADGGAIQTSGSGYLGANALTANGRSITGLAGRLATRVASVVATTTNGDIGIDDIDALNLTATATGGSVTARTGGALNVASASGTGVTLETTAGGDVTLTGALAGGAGNVDVASDGAIALNAAVTTTGDIRMSSGTGKTLALNSTVSGDEVELNAGTMLGTGLLAVGAGHHLTATEATLRGAQIGAEAARLETTLGSLNAESTSGGIFVTETDDLTLALGVARGGALSVRTPNGALTGTIVTGDSIALATGGDAHALTLLGDATATTGDVLLTTSGAGSDVILGGNVLAQGRLDIGANGDSSNVAVNGTLSGADGVFINAGSQAHGGMLTTGAAGTIVGQEALLTAGSIGSANARFTTDVASLSTESTNGGTFLGQQRDLMLQSTAMGGVLDVQTGGQLSIVSASADGVNLETTDAGSSIFAYGDIDGRAGDVNVETGGALVTLGAAVISGSALNANALVVGQPNAALNTRVDSMTLSAAGGGIDVKEADGVTVDVASNVSDVNLRTGNGSITVNRAAGTAVTLIAGGAGSGITLNGAVFTGSDGRVNLVADDAGDIVAGPGGHITAGSLGLIGRNIGSGSSPLMMTVDDVDASAQGSVDLLESDDLELRLTAGTNANVASASGGIFATGVHANGSLSLTAANGSITDDGDGSSVGGGSVTLRARSIGSASDRLDTLAGTLDAASAAGGIYIHEFNQLDGVKVHANGGAAGDIELLSDFGDINLLEVSATDSLLIAAGENILALPGLTTIVADSAEFRAGSDFPEKAGHIGTTARPLTVQLGAGKTLRLFVPDEVVATETARAPAVKAPSGGTLTATLSHFKAPDEDSTNVGFGLFQGKGEAPFPPPTSIDPPPGGGPGDPADPDDPGEPGSDLLDAALNEPSTLRPLREADLAPVDPDVSLYQTSDPAVCLPADQRKKGSAGC